MAFKSKRKAEKNVYAGTGISRDNDAYKAGHEAVEMAINNMIKQGAKKPDFGFVFCSGGKYGKDDKTIKQLVKGAHDAFMAYNKECKWIGCTTSGEITTNGFSQQSVVVAALNSEYLKFSVAGIEKIRRDPVKAGMQTTKNALSKLATDKYLDPFIHFTAMKKKTTEELIKMIPYTLIVLTTGVSSKLPPVESEFLEGIKTIVGANVPIVGGSAADDGILKETYVFANGELFKDGAIVTAMFSDLKLGFGMEHGYRPTGEIAYISKVSKDGHTILELNNKPAVEVIASWLNLPREELSKKIRLPTGAEIATINVLAQKNPFAISKKEGKFTLRVPIGITKEGGVVFAPKITVNGSLYLMEGSKKDVTNASKYLMVDLMKEYDISRPAFGIFFDCALRWYILMSDVGKEVTLLKEGLKNCPFVGFYTYGEIAAFRGETSHLCNQTITSLVISDEIYAG